MFYFFGFILFRSILWYCQTPIAEGCFLDERHQDVGGDVGSQRGIQYKHIPIPCDISYSQTQTPPLWLHSPAKLSPTASFFSDY